jgi:hypothetical protein
LDFNSRDTNTVSDLSCAEALDPAEFFRFLRSGDVAGPTFQVNLVALTTSSNQQIQQVYQLSPPNKAEWKRRQGP